MRCPYCHTPLPANTAECHACRLTFPRTCQLLGAVPRLSPGLADSARVLRKGDQARLRRKITEMETRFPQLVMQVLIHKFPETHPFPMHVFWIFNAASFAGELRRGKDNHALLLAVDPRRRESALMPGYGLEPLLPTESLGHLLDLASPAWEAGNWADGILRVLDGLQPLLESIAERQSPAMKPAGDF
jgi:uncharacterized membrane protein YgcG